MQVSVANPPLLVCWRKAGRICIVVALWIFMGGPLHAADFPQWRHLSSAAGEIPVPNGGREQTACLVLDIDRNGLNDIVIAERSQAPSVIWLRRDVNGWTQSPVETGKTPVAAGGAACDIDGAVAGRLKWYECTGDPQQTVSWVAHDLLGADANHAHSLQVADLNGDGRPDIASKPFVHGSPRVDVWLNLGTSCKENHRTH
ncbi:MAG: VCBS repeat-containing protein [Candidatus Sumerlaeia bacterium]|nr:VCBS repeat-containing protein [Candidatus Sumerlaeia bacterium]